ncbi:hypothetical protein GF359_00380 [candidate division WOR-3 bacterium]|uniref:STAS/SEC14 domain-containing protein n=1 Tax=candidate division WOR-3 bacterium TaxID=2052148 RepID=A0A9D5K8I0_UNCW3|nr:hypothetical protein [candidate division WOR-3 bacterium]MBD3363649.1 hypothetical protein [candidate division WOR-3 bacterium]
MNKHKVWFDDEKGILFLKLSGTFTTADGERYIPEIERLYKDRDKHYLLCDLTDGGTELPTDKSYRKWLIDMYERIGFNRIAMFNAKPSMRMLAKIVLAAAGKSNQVKFFSSHNDAVDWLKHPETVSAGK